MNSTFLLLFFFFNLFICLLILLVFILCFYVFEEHFACKHEVSRFVLPSPSGFNSTRTRVPQKIKKIITEFNVGFIIFKIKYFILAGLYMVDERKPLFITLSVSL